MSLTNFFTSAQDKISLAPLKHLAVAPLGNYIYIWVFCINTLPDDDRSDPSA